jgi:hypothetical protein
MQPGVAFCAAAALAGAGVHTTSSNGNAFDHGLKSAFCKCSRALRRLEEAGEGEVVAREDFKRYGAQVEPNQGLCLGRGRQV